MERAGFILFLLAYLHPTQRVLSGLPSDGVLKYFPGSAAPRQQVCSNRTTTAIDNCGKKIFHILVNPFPWCASNQIHSSQIAPSQDTVGDPLDCINHACSVFDDFQNCLAEKSIPDVCILSDNAYIFRAYTDVDFVCHRQKRSTNLIHALQCLKESRDLELLMYRMVERHGPSFADPYAQGNKNAFWRALNSESLIFTFRVSPRNMVWTLSLGMVCLSQNALLSEINAIITDSCGDFASHIVSEYFVYFRGKLNAILKEVGLPSTICDGQEVTSRNTVRRETAPADEQGKKSGTFHTQLVHFLEDKSDGTALDTVYGRAMLRGIKEMPEQNLCNVFLSWGLNDLLSGCFMLAHERSSKGIFNIVRFAHDARLPFMDYPQATVMKRLQMCVSLIQDHCGANYTNYFNFYYVMVHGTAQIQMMMDNLTCKWQDTLLRGYMQASEAGNVWPTIRSPVGRPLCLSSGWYTLGDIVKVMRYVWRHMEAGMAGISSRCGREAATQVEKFYNKLIYEWYNYNKYLVSLPVS